MTLLRQLHLILSCFCSFCFYHGFAEADTLKGSSLHPYGRYIVDGDRLELVGSAVHFGFSFTGTTASVFAYVPNPEDHGYIQYTLDGIYQKRIRVNGDQNNPIIIQTSSSKKHAVWVYKTTEATTGPVFIQQVLGPAIHPLKEPPLPMIEFIGNSITCGAAADPSEIPCDEGLYHDHHNAYYAYGPRIARDLHVNYMVSSVSGIGIYRNWNSLSPTMPQVYEKTDFDVNGSRLWDFNNYKPVIVSIALGTNDFSDGDHVQARLPFDSAAFVNKYIDFIRLVRSKYPFAKIALLSSPMLNGDKRVLLEHCLTAIKTQTRQLAPDTKPVAVFFFKPMHARGCGGHPSVEDHAILAKELVPFFKTLLKNN